MNNLERERPGRVILVLCVSICTCAILLCVLAFARSMGYATGLYTRVQQAGGVELGYWHVRCEQALTGGTLVFGDPLEGGMQSLTVSSRSAGGELALRITQGDREVEVDIANQDELAIPLQGFDSSQRIHLAIAHTRARDIEVDIQWE